MYTQNELKKMLKANLVTILLQLNYTAVILEERRAASKAVYQTKINGLVRDLQDCMCMDCHNDRRWMLSRFLRNLKEIKEGKYLPNFDVDTSNLIFTNPTFEKMTKEELIVEILRVDKEIIDRNTELVLYLYPFRSVSFAKWEQYLNAIMANPPKNAKLFYQMTKKACEEFEKYVNIIEKGV